MTRPFDDVHAELGDGAPGPRSGDPDLRTFGLLAAILSLAVLVTALVLYRPAAAEILPYAVLSLGIGLALFVAGLVAGDTRRRT